VLGEELLLSLIFSLGDTIIKHLQLTLDLLSWSLSLDLLNVELINLLLDLLQLLLLLISHLLGFVVLLLNLSELEGDLSDLVLLVLVGSGVVGGLEKSGGLHVFRGTVVDLELLGHHRSRCVGEDIFTFL
jgi:hypothetical protein